MLLRVIVTWRFYKWLKEYRKSAVLHPYSWYEGDPVEGYTGPIPDLKEFSISLRGKIHKR